MNLENVRCKYCRKLFPRAVSDRDKAKECVNNDCLRSRRFLIAGAPFQEENHVFDQIKIAIKDRSMRPMTDY